MNMNIQSHPNAMQAVHFGEVMKNMQRPTRKQAERESGF